MILMSLEGVLMSPTKQPIPEGISLYRSLVETQRVVIATESSERYATHWMRQHNLSSHADVIDGSVGFPETTLLIRQVEYIRPSSVGLIVILSDPETALQLVEDGVTVLLFSAGKYILPKDRLNRAHSKSWKDIEKEFDTRRSIPIVDEYE